MHRLNPEVQVIKNSVPATFIRLVRYFLTTQNFGWQKTNYHDLIK